MLQVEQKGGSGAELTLIDELDASLTSVKDL